MALVYFFDMFRNHENARNACNTPHTDPHSALSRTTKNKRGTRSLGKNNYEYALAPIVRFVSFFVHECFCSTRSQHICDVERLGKVEVRLAGTQHLAIQGRAGPRRVSALHAHNENASGVRGHGLEQHVVPLHLWHRFAIKRQHQCWVRLEKLQRHILKGARGGVRQTQHGERAVGEKGLD